MGEVRNYVIRVNGCVECSGYEGYMKELAKLPKLELGEPCCVYTQCTKCGRTH